jgi:hypothetical protein
MDMSGNLQVEAISNKLSMKILVLVSLVHMCIFEVLGIPRPCSLEASTLSLNYIPSPLHLIYLFLMGMKFQVRASHLQSRRSITRASPAFHFALVILEMGSLKIFARIGLELRDPLDLSLPSN